MRHIPTFETFMNEGSKNNKSLNEAAPYTIDKYIKDSEGDDFWIDIAKNIVKYMKLPANQIVWVTSDDDNEKWDEIQAYWEDEADYKTFTKEITGDSSSYSYFNFAKEIPMFQYEESGITAYMLPIKLYKSLGD